MATPQRPGKDGRPTARPRLIVLLVLASLLGLYAGVVLSIQRAALFPRPTASGAPPRPPDARQLWLSSKAGPVEAWYLPPTKIVSHPAPVLLFAHGNAELIDFMPTAFDVPRAWGFGVLLVEFPGYGRSAGSPSQSSVTSAILAAHDWAAVQPDIDPGGIVAYGRSLGGGAACALAQQRPVAALILESTFVSVRSFAHGFGVPEFMILDPFDNAAALKAYQGPLLELHGDHDKIVPSAQGRALAAEVKHSEFHLLSCGHNDCARPWPLIKKFLEANRLPVPL